METKIFNLENDITELRQINLGLLLTVQQYRSQYGALLQIADAKKELQMPDDMTQAEINNALAMYICDLNNSLETCKENLGSLNKRNTILNNIAKNQELQILALRQATEECNTAKSKNLAKLATIKNVTKKVMSSQTDVAKKTVEKPRQKAVAKQVSKPLKRAVKVCTKNDYSKAKPKVVTRFAIPQKPAKSVTKPNSYIKSVLTPNFARKVEVKKGVKGGAKIQELINIYGQKTKAPVKKVAGVRANAKPRECALMI